MESDESVRLNAKSARLSTESVRFKRVRFNATNKAKYIPIPLSRSVANRFVTVA